MKQLLTLIIVFLFCLPSFSQVEVEETISTPKSIKQQFEFIYNKSNNYTQFKVVKRDWFLKLKAQTLDSLKNIEAELKVAETKINDQQVVISKSEKALEVINQKLLLITNEKDAMPFLGISMTKKSYSVMVWSIVGVLLVLLGFFILKFNKNNTITKAAKANLKELDLEFEDHRRRALEREQKVMRKLQDELNKKK